jgi:hypothetical protein
MASREEVYEIKQKIYWEHRNGWIADYKADESDQDEIASFRAFVAQHGCEFGSDIVEIHSLGYETDLLGNMKLAERLYRIERSIEEIKFPETD